MMKTMLLPLLCALLSLGCPAKSNLPPPGTGQNPAQQPGQSKSDTTRIMAVLVDGSRIIGTTTQSSIPVQTAYTRTEIPFSLLLSASRDSSRSPFTVTTSTGDRLQATPVFENLELQTLLGRISIPVSSLASLTVVREAAGPREGLAAFYPFDGDATDRSGHHWDGVPHGPVLTADRHGLPDHAYLFHGKDDRIELPNGIINPSIRAFSVCAWVLTHDVDQERMIVFTGTRVGESAMNVVNGTFGFGVKCSDGSWHSARAPGVTEKYVFVVGVYSRGKVVQLWIDGERKAESPTPDLGLYPGPPLVSGSIGAYQPETDRPLVWDGVIDEVRIYDRALSPSEIEGMYAAGR